MNRTPKVAAVQDLSGLGRCSLSVVLPVLSVMGAQCCPLPTAVLSAHTAFPAPEAAATHFASGKPPVYDFSLPQFCCGGKGEGGACPRVACLFRWNNRILTKSS